jgi:signal transduction histidine kinase
MAAVAAAVILQAITWGTPAPAESFGPTGFASLLAVALGTVGLLIATRRSDSPIGWILLVSGLVSATTGLADLYAIYALLAEPDRGLPGGSLAAWVTEWLWIPMMAGITIFLLSFFPTGRLVSRRWLWVPLVGAVGTVLASVGEWIGTAMDSFPSAENPFGGIAGDVPVQVTNVGLGLFLLAMLGAGASLVVRFRRSRGDERQQMKWLALAASLPGSALIVFVIVSSISPTGVAIDLAENLVIASMFAVPTATGIAVLRYRLYEIDIVVSKAVVIGLLAGFITVAYVAIVVGAGAAVGSQGDAVLSAIAAAAVALAFQPVRRWARRVADRLVYGRRATPYEVLSGFTVRLGDSYSVEDVLPRLARVLAEGIGADEVIVWLAGERGYHIAARWPDVEGPRELLDLGDLPGRAFEVRHQGDPLGAITVAMPRSDQLNPAQERLVADVAAQAGLVMRNVRLIEELRESRLRIVTAQDARAKKLERNIHDGAQQQLVALSVRANLAKAVAAQDPLEAEKMLGELQVGIIEVLEELRDLARGIYPPLLADQGIPAALRAQARKAAIPTTVDADGIGRFAPDIEAAVYFCCLEALTNIAKYAEASSATLSLEHVDGLLTFVVSDDGGGFDPVDVGYGTGLRGMADRMDAIGGQLEVDSAPGRGTTVIGRLPASTVE